MFMVPSGIPLLTRICPNLRADNGVSSDGFNIALQPVAKTGVILKIAIRKGKFHGIIYPQTPIGIYYVKDR